MQRHLSLYCVLLFSFLFPTVASAEERGKSMDILIDNAIEPLAKAWDAIIFVTMPIFGQAVPIILLLLAGTAVFLTIYFRFANLRLLPLAIRTVKGKYTPKDAPGEISHFQALTAALSATVGLGNIAGVAVAIGLGGPGATFWMVLLGFCGMATKFCECTLGVKYREIDKDGKCSGGPMYYLTKGLKEKGMGGFGKFLAVLFAVMTIGGAIGAGNMYQVNQAHSQFSDTFGIMQGEGWQFGLIVALLVGTVIIGGIVWIAKVTEILVPFMCGIYVLAGFVILGMNADQIIPAFGEIIQGAFMPSALVGGFVGAMIQGVKRAAFSNEAGVGSAPIAHSAVKTEKPASEGLVALLEPLTDTVIVCTMTALVLVISGTWKIDGTVREGQTVALYEDVSGEPGETVLRNVEATGQFRLQEEADFGDRHMRKAVDLETEAKGWISYEELEVKEKLDLSEDIKKTSNAFASAIPWFPYILSISVVLFAFSTMISWSYYGEQALVFMLGGRNQVAIILYKLGFCVFTVIGAASSLGNVLLLSDAMLFSMVLPNLIGLYFLLPIVKRELADFRGYSKKVDSGEIKVD